MIRFFIILALAFSFSAFAAEESETRTKIEDLKQKNVTPGEDVDDIITNNLLRAESGSKSRWSVASAINYFGSTIERPFAESRPNIAATTADTNESLLGGQVSLKYSITNKTALMAGVGVRWMSPLRDNRKHTGAREDMDNPYLIYQRLYKWSGVESVLQVQPTFYTNNNLRDHGYVSTVLINQDNMFVVNQSKASIGMSIWAQGGYFNKKGPSSGSPDDPNYLADVRDDQADYLFGVSPVFEYAFSDKYNFRTVTNLYNFEHLRSAASGTYVNDTVNQSVGIGISITRDIFVYPNVQFLPEHMRADMTNVGVNSNINLF